jgi:predicted RND superfamily exporter protein
MQKRLRDLERPNRYKDFLRWIAGVQVRHPVLTLGVLLVVTIALIGGITQVRTVASLEQMMPRDIEEIRAFNTLRDAGLGQDMLAIVIRLDPDATSVPDGDILDYEYYRYTRALKGQVAGEDAVLSAYAFSDIVDAIAQRQGVAVGPDGVAAQPYAAIIAEPRVREQLAQFVNHDRTTTIIMISTDVSADDLRMNLLATKLREDIDTMGRPRATTLSITGTPVIQQKLGEVIEHDRGLTEKLSALFVFALVAIVFGSVIAAFVPMASIILSIIWLYGMMGYLGLPISTLAGGVAAMVIGIGVDFSIHLRNKFEYERKRGEPLEYAVEETMANTGYVLTVVTAVTAIAFLTFLLGDMPEMGRFGLLMGMGVTLAFILSVIGLPALFIVEERIIYWVKSRLRFGVEKELHLEADVRGEHVEQELRAMQRRTQVPATGGLSSAKERTTQRKVRP